MINKDDTKQFVRNAYASIAKKATNGCGCGIGCDDDCNQDPQQLARKLGYSEEELSIIPQEANLGLSCGNPTAIASLKPGEIVLDLGSGGGFDCFLAASKVGPTGKVIGVDMTPEMIDVARNNAKVRKATNVEFRLGEIENLPVPDNSVDVVISNCVINLSPDKSKVLQEIYRVLKPGGRVAISDTALTKELPPKIQESIAAYSGCISGAILISEYKGMLEKAGLKEASVTIKGSSCIAPNTNDPIGRAIVESLKEIGASIDDLVVSVNVSGKK